MTHLLLFAAFDKELNDEDNYVWHVVIFYVFAKYINNITNITSLIRET